MRRWYLIITLLCAVMWGVHTVRASVTDTPISISVLASSSLTNVMTQLTREYAKQAGYTVAVTYASPAELAQAIEEGESADLFITEDPQKMVELKQKGLIDVFTLSNIVENSLVLVAAKDHYLSKYVSSDIVLNRMLEDLNERALLVMGDPDNVPIGMHAKEAITKLGYWENIATSIVRTESSRRALYLIAKGRNAGITYYTDAFNNPEVKIITAFPHDLHTPIIYQAAVVAGLNMQYAREFLSFIKSEWAQHIFKQYGFLVD